MVTPLVRPPNYGMPFANAGAKNVISVASNSPNASFTDGFPPVTMLPLTSGGVPPAGKDFNGLFFDITQHTVWVNAGGQYRYDSALVTATGGYAQGCVLQSNDGLSAYVSLINNNTHDFNSDPTAIGPYWGLWSGNAANVLIDNHITSNTTATFFREYGLDTTSSAFNLTLPASPSDGYWLDIYDYAGTWPLKSPTLVRNGSPTIMGVAENMLLPLRNFAGRLRYIAASNDWRFK